MITAVRPPGPEAAKVAGAPRPLQGRELIAHLLARTGFGATPAEIDRCLAQGYERTVHELLHPDDVPESPVLAEDLCYRYFPDWATEQFNPESTWLFRMIHTRRPLREKMALFWHGHFPAPGTRPRLRAMSIQLHVLQEHGLGRFADLLSALAEDPTIARSLDSDDGTPKGTRDDRNANYGRELLDLLPLGLTYTAADLEAASRAFTGWAARPRYPLFLFGSYPAEFAYVDALHDHGEKTFLGETGPWNGQDIFAIISRQTETARFVATKLHRFFVSDTADEAEIDFLAEVFLHAGGDLRAVMEALLLSDFFRAEDKLGAKVKSPAELVAGTARRTGEYQLPDPHLEILADALVAMGQPLFFPPCEKEWTGGLAWIDTGTWMERVNFAAVELDDPHHAAVQALVQELAALRPDCSSDVVVDHALAHMGVLHATQATRDTLVDHVLNDGALRLASETDGQRAAERFSDLLVLIGSSPEYQFT